MFHEGLDIVKYVGVISKYNLKIYIYMLIINKANSLNKFIKLHFDHRRMYPTLRVSLSNNKYDVNDSS